MENVADHSMFDSILRDHSIIELSEHNCDQVHNRMDRDMRNHDGTSHYQERDPYHNEESIRDWIRHGRDCFWDNVFTVLSLGDNTNVGDHASSDFVRVAFGHIVLDHYWVKHKVELESGEKTSDEVVRRAFDEFCRQGYDSMRFRRR